MKRLYAAALVLGAFLSGDAGAKETTIKLATVAPEGTPWVNALVEFDKDLQERTKGELKLKIYPASQGDEKLYLKKMKAGQLQAAALTGMTLGEICSWARLLEVPFTYRSPAEVDYVRGKLDARIRAEFEKKGYVLIGWSELGTATLYSTKELRGVADVKASKPWLWEGDPLAAEAYRAFGVNPTPLSLPEVITSLQSGLVDTVYSAPSACVGLQWHTKLRYRVDVPLTIATGASVVTKSFLDKLPEEQRKVVLELGKKYEETLIATARRDNEEAIRILEEKGVKTVVWSAEEVAKNWEMGTRIADALAGEGEGKLFPKEMLEEVRGYLKELREKQGAAPGK